MYCLQRKNLKSLWCTVAEEKKYYFLEKCSVLGVFLIFSAKVHHKELRLLVFLSVRPGASLEISNTPIGRFSFLSYNGVLGFFRPMEAGVKWVQFIFVNGKFLFYTPRIIWQHLTTMIMLKSVELDPPLPSPCWTTCQEKVGIQIISIR